jgi:hypothetical protein
MKFILLFIVLIIIYIYCYFIFPSTIQILQTTISDFNFSLLYTRQPIVISDYLHEKEKLIHSWFQYNFIYKINNNENDEWIHNNHKYLFINANNDTEIIIYKASIYNYIPNEDDTIIAIKLEKNQSLIIPYKWKYYIKTKDDIDIWAIDDLITYVLQFVF